VGGGLAALGQGAYNLYNGNPLTQGFFGGPAVGGIDDSGFDLGKTLDRQTALQGGGFGTIGFDGVGGIDSSDFDLGQTLDRQTQLQGGGFGDFGGPTNVGGIDDSNFDLGKTLERQTTQQGGGFGSVGNDAVGGIDDSTFDLGKTIGTGGGAAVGGGALDTIKNALPDGAKKIFDTVVGKGTDILTAGAIGTLLGSLFGEKTDRKSTRLNSSHRCIAYAGLCLKTKKVMM